MCGIAGASWSDMCGLTLKQKEIILRLGAFGADKRGGQSFGVITVDSVKHTVRKGMGPLVGANWERLAQSDLLFAHSRFATQGAINLANSHPFKIGRIVGVHNGVIFNASELDRKYGKRAVDSEHIFARLNKNQGIEDFEGYGIVVWYDLAKPGQIFMANIGGGSLTLFEVYDKNNTYLEGYFWTSLEEDGSLALASAGIENYESYDLAEGVVYTLKHGGEDIEKTDQTLSLKVRQRFGLSSASYRRADGSDPRNDESEIGDETALYSADEFASWWKEHNGEASEAMDPTFATEGQEGLLDELEKVDQNETEASEYLEKEYASIQEALSAKIERG
jgi:hypothetical protein